MTREQHAECIRTAAMKRADAIWESAGRTEPAELLAIYAEVLVQMLLDERTTGFHHNGTNRQFEMKAPPPEPVT